MLHGNISSKEAPRIAFDIDSLFFTNEPLDRGIFSRILRHFKTDEEKYFERVINDTNRIILEIIWMHTPYSVSLVSFDCLNVTALNEFFTAENFPYTRIECFMEWKEVRRRLDKGIYSYFFTQNSDLQSYLGKNTGSIIDWRSIIG